MGKRKVDLEKVLEFGDSCEIDPELFCLDCLQEACKRANHLGLEGFEITQVTREERRGKTMIIFEYKRVLYQSLPVDFA